MSDELQKEAEASMARYAVQVAIDQLRRIFGDEVAVVVLIVDNREPVQQFHMLGNLSVEDGKQLCAAVVEVTSYDVLKEIRSPGGLQ